MIWVYNNLEWLDMAIGNLCKFLNKLANQKELSLIYDSHLGVIFKEATGMLIMSKTKSLDRITLQPDLSRTLYVYYVLFLAYPLPLSKVSV